jgi:hypothetical protein
MREPLQRNAHLNAKVIYIQRGWVLLGLEVGSWSPLIYRDRALNFDSPADQK